MTKDEIIEELSECRRTVSMCLTAEDVRRRNQALNTAISAVRTIEFLNKNRFEVPIGKNKIVTEVYDYDGKHPEISVYITDDSDMILQDICLVRHHVVDIDQHTTDKAVDCIVWADVGIEDYTNKYVIEVYKNDE